MESASVNLPAPSCHPWAQLCLQRLSRPCEEFNKLAFGFKGEIYVDVDPSALNQGSQP